MISIFATAESSKGAVLVEGILSAASAIIWPGRKSSSRFKTASKKLSKV